MSMSVERYLDLDGTLLPVHYLFCNSFVKDETACEMYTRA